MLESVVTQRRFSPKKRRSRDRPHLICGAAAQAEGKGPEGGRGPSLVVRTWAWVAAPFGVSKRGFSLLELLVVIAIIGLLAAVGLPALKGFGQANTMSAANRQVLTDLSLARLRAINERTTVYVLFTPPNIGQHLQNLASSGINPKLLQSMTNVAKGQYSSYAMYAARHVGDQPGQHNPRYLTEWRHLPEGVFIPRFKFEGGQQTNVYNRPFDFRPFPVPSVTSTNRNQLQFPMPYIGFNPQGQLIPYQDGARQDVLIPLAKGSVFVEDATREADVVMTPPNNYTNNYLRINWLTGRADMDEATRPELP